MIRFSYHRYLLHPKNSLSAVADQTPREGILFKMVWPDQKIGYADLFPWPELGDPNVDQHLEELKKRHIPKLLEQTIWLGRKDAILRSQGKNALSDATRIKNHFLITDFTQVNESLLNEAKSAGFTTMKVKVGRDWKAETEWLNKILRSYPFTCRLDFNSKGDLASLERMFSHLVPGLKQKIEFVEDPFPWDYDTWMDAAKIARLALDQEYVNINWRELTKELPFRVIVIKPARQDLEEVTRFALLKNLKMVITSSMDHPVGVVHAVRVAAELKKQHSTQVLECGCLTMKSYKPNQFSTQMIVQGPYLSQVKGTGIGFDQVLDDISWIPVEFI